MINVDDIITIIKDQEESAEALFADENIIKRELKIKQSSLKTGAAHIITGPRRAGKSVLTLQIVGKEKCGQLNFNDERLRMEASELNKVLEAIYRLRGDTKLLIFDEIQEVPGWERFISRLVDSKCILITGSNAKMMSKELATYLTGRHIDYMLLPFSFSEFLTYKGVKPNIELSTREKVAIRSMLKEFLHIGGFPLAVKNGSQFLMDLYRDMVERDISQRYHIRLTSKLSDMARYLIANTSNEITYNKLRKIFGISGKRTVQNWINYMENAYLLFKLERFSFKLKEAIMAPKKIYAIDTGLARTISLNVPINALMENTVAIELLRRKMYHTRQIEINYWKDHLQREVDFVLRTGNKIIKLIQVTYVSDIKELNDREVRSLISASKEFKCDNLFIITWDYESVERINGKKINFIPLWKWLLQ